MNVQIPIAGLTLSNGQTYNGQLPVWATRPLMVKVTPDFISGNEYPVYVRVSNGGAIKKEITLPYQETVNLDLSFAAPLLRRADRNKSEGDPAFPQQEVEIWSSNIANKITLPVFHCDETYWDTLGVDGALPQPPKPRIPGQTLDIYFPYRIHPLDALSVEVEPVTGAPSSAIFPTTYVLGNTIDITYIKKLTIKNVWGSGLDQVINYEDRLHTDAIYDESLQCALRARWNMRNGQWFWAAFKDYFWSNKFTPIRGRGGVTEQAELTINLEYGEEWYNVYQELLVSSNVVFELNIPGINQYQNKRFRAEVSGDTGARWSNSTKTYRQQVRFKTTELQDNYMFPLAPDNPPTPSIAFSAQRNPWTIGAAYAEGLVNSIYSNTAWEVQSTPAWLSVGDMVTLTAADFEQGGLSGAAGTSYEDTKFDSSGYIRSKNPLPVYGKPVFIRAFVPGFEITTFVFGTDMKLIATDKTISGANQTKNVNAPGVAYASFRVRKDPASDTVPSDATTAKFGVSVNRFNGSAGASNLTATVAANNGEARTGNIVLKSKAGATTYALPITQAKAAISLTDQNKAAPSGADAHTLLNFLNANTPWTCTGYPTWCVPILLSGEAQEGLFLFYNMQANTGAPRSANITYRSTVNPSVQASFRVDQAGGSISVTPSAIEAGYVHLPVTVSVTSLADWSVSAHDTWITPSQLGGLNGTTNVTLTIDDNTADDPRTGTITFNNDLTGQTVVVTVNQAGVPVGIAIDPAKVTAPKTAGTVKQVVCGSANGWMMLEKPSWVTVSPTSGAAGLVNMDITYTANNTGLKRSGYLKIRNTITNKIAICIIEQEG